MLDDFGLGGLQFSWGHVNSYTTLVGTLELRLWVLVVSHHHVRCLLVFVIYEQLYVVLVGGGDMLFDNVCQ